MTTQPTSSIHPASSEWISTPLLNHARYPLILLSVVLLLCVFTGINPAAGHINWMLTVGPGLILVTVLSVAYRWVPMSHYLYTFVFIHMLLLIYAGYYSDVQAPLGEWFREEFAMSRNHADRVGHVALGVGVAVVVREILLRRTPLPAGGWMFFLTTSVVMAIGALWELMEWWFVLGSDPEVGQSFLGVQGDVWDAQWDMFLALIGSVVVLVVGRSTHDASMARVPDAPGFVQRHDRPNWTPSPSVRNSKERDVPTTRVRGHHAPS